MPKKVAIQGIKGSFHDQVVEQYFSVPPVRLECSTFDELAQSIDSGKCDLGVMAIENSIAGSILPNYALLDQYELVITGEHFLRIEHNLMALPGQKIQEIEEVHSHPMALLQCKKFFRKHPHIKLVESHDTAEEAYKIGAQKWTSKAAIASVRAAEIYGLEILNPSIQTIKNNVTRFIILQKKEEDKSQIPMTTQLMASESRGISPRYLFGDGKSKSHFQTPNDHGPNAESDDKGNQDPNSKIK